MANASEQLQEGHHREAEKFAQFVKWRTKSYSKQLPEYGVLAQRAEELLEDINQNLDKEPELNVLSQL